MKYTVRLKETTYYEIDVNAESDGEVKKKAWNKLFALPRKERAALIYDSDGNAEIIHKHEVDE